MSGFRSVQVTWICTFICQGVTSTVSAESCKVITQIALSHFTEINSTPKSKKDCQFDQKSVIFKIFLFFSSSSYTMWSVDKPTLLSIRRNVISKSFELSSFELYIIRKLWACLPSKLFHCNSMIYWKVIYHIPHLQRPDPLYFSTTKCSLEIFITAIWINASCYPRRDQTETSTEVQLTGISQEAIDTVMCSSVTNGLCSLLKKGKKGSKIEQAPRA